jgi:hypothetical protein
MTRDTHALRGGGALASEASTDSLGCCPACTEAPGLTALEYQRLSLRDSLCTRCCARRFSDPKATHHSPAGGASSESPVPKGTSSSEPGQSLTGPEQQTDKVGSPSQGTVRTVHSEPGQSLTGPEQQTDKVGSPAQGTVRTGSSEPGQSLTGPERQTEKVSHLLRAPLEHTASLSLGQPAQALARVTSLSGSPSQGTDRDTSVLEGATSSLLKAAPPLR